MRVLVIGGSGFIGSLEPVRDAARAIHTSSRQTDG
jgi:hypothetical protein